MTAPDTQAGGLSADEREALAGQIDGTEDLMDLLKAAADAMHDAVPDGTFVNVRPLQDEVLAAWLAARLAAERERIAQAIEAACDYGQSRDTCDHCCHTARIARGGDPA